MNKRMKAWCVAVALFSMVSLSQGIITRTWTGAVDGNWSNVNNWVSGALPQATGVEGSLNKYDEHVIISEGINPTSNVPKLNGSGPAPLLQVGAGMSVDYTLSSGYDGLNQVRPESMGGTDAVAVGVNGSLTVHQKDGGSVITLARQQDTLTRFVYRVAAGGVLDLAASRVEFGYRTDGLTKHRLSHMILDGGTYQQTGGNEFWGTHELTSNYSTNWNVMTLSNGATFAGTNVFLTKMFSSAGDKTMVFDITDEASSVNFKLKGGSFYYFGDVVAARGTTFTSSTFGDDALVFTDNGDDTVTVTAVDPNTYTPYQVWLSEYALGAFTNQLDDAENGGIGDGLNNLMEYALGSAPDTVDVPADVLPILQVDGGVFNYIYTRQNPQDTNLTYAVLVGTDLMLGSLVNTNTFETVSVATNGFETVTNQVSTAIEGQQFMKLQVEIN